MLLSRTAAYVSLLVNSRGSAATCVRCGVMYEVTVVRNFFYFQTFSKFGKSVQDLTKFLEAEKRPVLTLWTIV